MEPWAPTLHPALPFSLSNHHLLCSWAPSTVDCRRHDQHPSKPLCHCQRPPWDRRCLLSQTYVLSISISDHQSHPRPSLECPTLWDEGRCCPFCDKAQVLYYFYTRSLCNSNLLTNKFFCLRLALTLSGYRTHHPTLIILHHSPQLLKKQPTNPYFTQK